LFNSVTAFDRHRVGTFGTIRQPGTRRCLTAPELTAAGMSLNGAGFWITESVAERRERRGRTRHSGDRQRAAVLARGVP
jgi:hypothetical protein